MPFMTNGKRDYKKQAEWEKNEKPEIIAGRVERKKARRWMIAEGKAAVGDGKDVGHKKAISKGGKTTKGNIEMQSAAENRSFKRNSKGGMVSEKSLREKKK